MDRSCEKNPQLPPHRHYRYDGALWCEGYAPEFKNLAEKLLHDIRIFTEQSAEKK